MKSHVKITADGSDSGSNVGVGFRAMGDVNTLVFDHLDFLICGMNTVGHDSRACIAACRSRIGDFFICCRFRSKQSKHIIRIPIKSACGTKLLYPCNFPEIFRQMRLNWNVVFPLDFSQLGHQLIRTGWGKTWGKDRVGVVVTSLDFFQPLACILCRSLCTFLLKFRCSIAIHIYFSNHSCQAAFLQHVHEKLRCRTVQGGENAGSGGEAVL